LTRDVELMRAEKALLALKLPDDLRAQAEWWREAKIEMADALRESYVNGRNDRRDGF
jgi:hypothetical protein